jgi:hypothetical protein
MEELRGHSGRRMLEWEKKPEGISKLRQIALKTYERFLANFIHSKIHAGLHRQLSLFICEPTAAFCRTRTNE